MKKKYEKIIKYLAEGFTFVEIAEKMGYSHSTIKHYVMLMRQEMKAKNSATLVYEYLKKYKNIDLVDFFEVE